MGQRASRTGRSGLACCRREGPFRYLQVINIRDTGIDFAIKPGSCARGEPQRSERSGFDRATFSSRNNAFRDTQTLLGRCVVVPRDCGKVNISQHIDRIRVESVSPFYVCAFLKSSHGRTQIERVTHGVDSTGISFGRILDILIPEISPDLQAEIESQYVAMSQCH